MKRLSSRKQLGTLIGTVVMVGAGGWFAGTQVRSPADAAAAHHAPKAGPVTVAVERQSLTATVVSTGSVEFASPEPLSLAGSVGTGTSAAAADKGAEQRVTKAPTAGTQVKEGDVLMTVNGRPVFALSGSVPMYRDLGPGTSGDDVKELQRALRRLGFEPGAVSGTYGQGTAAALTGWYTSKGYQAQQPSPDEQQQLGQLQQAVSSAQETLLTAKAGGTSGKTAPKSGSAAGAQAPPKTGAETRVKDGTQTEDDASDSGATSDTDTGSGTGTDTGSGTDTDTGSGSDTDAGSHTDTTPASDTDTEIQKIQLQSAQKALDMANAALSTFQASYGTKLPAGEAVFFPKLPVRLDKVTVKTGDAATGQIGTVTSSDVVVQAVLTGTDATLLRKGMAVDVTTTDGENTAAKGVVEAIGADAAPPSSSASGGMESGGTDGGTEPGGTGPGGTEPDGSAASGTGAGAGDPSSGPDSSAPVQLRVSLPDPGALAGEAGASVKVSIKVGASDGEVLTVPLAAIRTSADGTARVQVRRDGRVSDVHVTVGLSAAGLAEVKPAGGALRQGDQVVVGE